MDFLILTNSDFCRETTLLSADGSPCFWTGPGKASRLGPPKHREVSVPTTVLAQPVGTHASLPSLRSPGSCEERSVPFVTGWTWEWVCLDGTGELSCPLLVPLVDVVQVTRCSDPVPTALLKIPLIFPSA